MVSSIIIGSRLWIKPPMQDLRLLVAGENEELAEDQPGRRSQSGDIPPQSARDLSTCTSVSNRCTTLTLSLYIPTVRFLIILFYHLKHQKVKVHENDCENSGASSTSISPTPSLPLSFGPLYSFLHIPHQLVSILHNLRLQPPACQQPPSCIWW